ncbi:olfactory receptor 52L1-like [Hyperolius riggenbachi]|uniref:olfactory receptor 52L1-like n=1 Tax=Hyperolius riggenbachi TaxID=752182 RepID=UPI0035A29F48
MNNGTFSQPSTLSLNFGVVTSMRYFYCVIVFFGYTLNLTLNLAVIATIIRHESLHQSMYVFIAALCFNGVYGSSCFYPSLFIHLLQETHSISYIACLTQVFCIHTYVSYEMSILAAMAYDRYVCICNPLRYNIIMTLPTVFKLLAGAYVQPTVLFNVHFLLTIRLPLCSSEILKIYCDNWSVVRLSCIDTTVNNYFGTLVATIVIGLMPLFTFYTYVKIFKVCLRSSKEVRQKALQICSPHLICIVNFLTASLFEILLYRFIPDKLPYELRVLMSVQPFVIPPFLNPVIYGMKMKEIKVKIVLLLRKTDFKYPINI